MSSPCWVVWRVFALLVACTCASSVYAQASSVAAEAVEANAQSETYRTTIGEALRHFGAHRWHDALLAFRRAHVIDPSARTLRGIALAALYLEDFATARTAIEDALASTAKPLDSQQRAELTRLLPQAQQRTSVVTVQAEPPSASVEVNGEPRDAARIVLAQGTHLLRVSADGHAEHREAILVNAGVDRDLIVRLTPHVAAPASPELSPSSVDISPRHTAQAAVSTPADGAPPTQHAAAATEVDPGGHTWTWVAAAAVPVFVATALISWKLGSDAHTQIENDCRENGCDQATIDRRSEAAHLSTYETITTISWIGAGSSVALGVLAFVLESESR